MPSFTTFSSIWLTATALVFSYLSKLTYLLEGLFILHVILFIDTVQLRYHIDCQGWSSRTNQHTKLELLICFEFVFEFVFFPRIMLVLGLSKDPWKSLRHQITTITSSIQWVSLRPRLHWSGQIFARTNFVPGPPVYTDPCKFCCSGVYTGPCKV